MNNSISKNAITVFLTYLAAGLLLGVPASAEMIGLNQGLEKINKNAVMSEQNKGLIEKQMTVVGSNLNEIKKSKDVLTNHKKTISGDLAKNAEAVKKTNAQEKEITGLIEQEKTKMAAEDKQVQQLQGLIDQLKQTQQQRQVVITDYQAQLAAVVQSRAQWLEREGKIKAQETDNTEHLRQIASDETQWNQKRGDYDKDLKKWTQETARTKKVKDTFQGLVDGK